MSYRPDWSPSGKSIRLKAWTPSAIERYVGYDGP